MSKKMKERRMGGTSHSLMHEASQTLASSMKYEELMN
jgi:hypothetical protein